MIKQANLYFMKAFEYIVLMQIKMVLDKLKEIAFNHAMTNYRNIAMTIK